MPHNNITTYTCINCGAQLNFKPGTSSLHCAYCDSYTPIQENGETEIVELDYKEYAQQFEELNGQLSKLFVCSRCGAESLFDEEIKSAHCPYCNTSLIEPDAHNERIIRPMYLLPFNVDADAISGYLKRWINSLWFAPDKLKKFALLSSNLNGVYIPCWTFDAQTYTRYKGKRGRNRISRKGERSTSWESRSGEVSLFIDDVLVPASRMIPKKTLYEMPGWDTQNLVEADNRYLSGFITEKYTLVLVDGYPIAKEEMINQIQARIKQDIGGDKQIITSMQTEYQSFTFKLILLPVYIASYTWKKKQYHFFVNGRNGNITGDRPHSTVKIIAAIVLGIILVFLYLRYFH